MASIAEVDKVLPITCLTPSALSVATHLLQVRFHQCSMMRTKGLLKRCRRDAELDTNHALGISLAQLAAQMQ